MLNSARAANGLASLSMASDLTAVAAERARIMARSGSLSHTPDLGGRVCCWTWLGENSAYGGSVRTLHSVLMGSAPHRANILNSAADDVGVAVVSAGGNLWAAQVFRARSDGGDRSVVVLLDPVNEAAINVDHHARLARWFGDITTVSGPALRSWHASSSSRNCVLSASGARTPRRTWGDSIPSVPRSATPARSIASPTSPPPPSRWMLARLE